MCILSIFLFALFVLIPFPLRQLCASYMLPSCCVWTTTRQNDAPVCCSSAPSNKLYSLDIYISSFVYVSAVMKNTQWALETKFFFENKGLKVKWHLRFRIDVSVKIHRELSPHRWSTPTDRKVKHKSNENSKSISSYLYPTHPSIHPSFIHLFPKFGKMQAALRRDNQFLAAFSIIFSMFKLL